MASPLPYKKFAALVRRYDCEIELHGSHGTIKKDGKFVASFAITHGKRSKANEVKGVYVQQFLRAMRGE